MPSDHMIGEVRQSRSMIRNIGQRKLVELVIKLRKANLALICLALNECLYVSILKLDNRLRVPKARLECFQSYNILAVLHHFNAQ